MLFTSEASPMPATESSVTAETAYSWPIILGCLVIIIGIGALAYIVGFRALKLVGLRRAVWFLPRHVTRYAQQWGILWAAAAVWACLIFLLSWPVLRLMPALEPMSNPGLVFVLAGLLCTLAGLLNTIALLNQRLGHISRFDGLFYRLDDIVREIEARNPHRLSHAVQREEILLLDYTPLIGEVSAGDDIAIQNFNVLERLRCLRTCECHFVFLASQRLSAHQDAGGGDLERFYRRTLGLSQGPEHGNSRDAFDRAVDDRVRAAEAQMKWLDGPNVAVWRSRRIHSEHYFVSPNSALTYYVTPEVNGAKNQLRGEKTEDLAQVEFIRDVVMDYIRDAVTPHVEKCTTCNSLILSFAVGQENVAAIEVIFAKERASLFEKELLEDIRKGRIAQGMRLEIPVRGGLLVAGGSCCRYACTIPDDAQWIKVRLRKMPDPKNATVAAVASLFSYGQSVTMAKERVHSVVNEETQA